MTDSVGIIHTELAPAEAADRLALRELFDAYATHFNGQSTVTIDGNSATGESYTIVHDVYTENGTRKIMVASFRYLDTFAKTNRRWYFAERRLVLDWSETRTLGTDETS